MRPLFLVLTCLLTWPFAVLSQTLGVIGSSTAYGLDAHPLDSSWVNLTASWYRSRGQLTTLINLAQSGATSYAGLPWSNTPGRGYPKVDTANDVTALLNLQADLIIVAYPSNDIGLGYTLTRWLANLRVIRDSIVKAGKRYYIATSQPRSDLNDFDRKQLKQARDSILAEFPFTLNFFDPVADPVTLKILPQYDAGQGVHLNNAGHTVLFQVAKAANIMQGAPLPLTNTAICKILTPANGATPVVTINFPVPRAFRIILFNTSGIAVRRESYTVSSSATIPLPGLPAGQYILRIFPDQGDPVTKTFIKF